MTKKVKDKNTGEDKWLNRVYVKDKTVLQNIKSEIVAKYNREIKFGGGPTPEAGTPTGDAPAQGQTEFPF